MNDTSKRPIYILVSLTIVSLVLIGGGLYMYLSQKSSSEDTSVTPSTSVPSDWKTYHDAVSGLEFRYPPAWGEVDSSYSVKKLPYSGQISSIAFTNSRTASATFLGYPSITLASKDSTCYEGCAYNGQGNLVDMYDGESDYKTEPVFFNIGERVQAVSFITTNNNTTYAPDLHQMLVYANITDSIFAGMEVSVILDESLPRGEPDEIAFIQGVKDKNLSSDLQARIDEFNLFVSTFQFTSPTVVSTSDWKTYTNNVNHYKIKYPPTWVVDEYSSTSMRILNPLHSGKYDTDTPVEAFGIGIIDEPCLPSDWEEGFGLVYYKTDCVSNHPFLILQMSAWDKESIPIEDTMISSFVITETVADIKPDGTNKCGLFINSPVANAIVRFPLGVYGVVDQSVSGCTWQMFEGQAGTAQLYFKNTNDVWQAIGSSAPIMVGDWTADSTNFTVVLNFNNSGIGLAHGTQMKVVLTEANPSGIGISDKIEIPLVLK